MMRTIGAFLVAPFPAALLQSTVVALWPKTDAGIFEHPSSMLVAICLYFYIVGVLIGFPAWIFMRRRSAEMRAYVLLGVMAGLLPIVVTLATMADNSWASACIIVYNLMLFGSGGATAGALVWLIAVRKKPSTELERTFI